MAGRLARGIGREDVSVRSGAVGHDSEEWGRRARTIRDRVVETAAKLVLEPIFEADFEDNAYGYRPARGAADAVKDVYRHLSRGYTDVVDADLSRYLCAASYCPPTHEE